MGQLTKRAGRILGAVALLLAGTGVLLLAGTGTANARPAGNVCQDIATTLTNLDTTLSTSHLSVEAEITLIASKYTQAASTGSPAVKSAVRKLVADLEAEGAKRTLDVAKLEADNNAVILVACAPKGDPATGGGSTAGLQDPALFGLGGAVVLAGVVILCLTPRIRLRTSMGQR
jgi:hypothetical protein